jgi:hypothetical protein
MSRSPVNGVSGWRGPQTSRKYFWNPQAASTRIKGAEPDNLFAHLRNVTGLHRAETGSGRTAPEFGHGIDIEKVADVSDDFRGQREE